ncbi:MAG: STAS domain-containing protein [Actinoplanes sp.]
MPGTPTVLALAGELDINVRDDLREQILAAVADGDVTLDLDQVTFIDSEALSALIDGYNTARECGTRFGVINAHGLVERVLAVSGTLDLFRS